jgi:hypothetical protein
VLNRHGRQPHQQWITEVAYRSKRLVGSGMGAGVAPGDDSGFARPEGLWERRGSRDLGDADPSAQVIGKGRKQVAVPAEEVLNICDVVEHRPADDYAAFPPLDGTET